MRACMITSAILSAIHILTVAIGFTAVFIRGRALARPLDGATWRELLAAGCVYPNMTLCR